MMVIENGAAGEIYNIGSNVIKSNNEIAETLINLAHPEFQASYRFIEDRKGHDFRYSVDFSKIRKLGFKPEITFTVGIKETYKWYRSKFIS